MYGSNVYSNKQCCNSQTAFYWTELGGKRKKKTRTFALVNSNNKKSIKKYLYNWFQSIWSLQIKAIVMALDVYLITRLLSADRKQSDKRAYRPILLPVQNSFLPQPQPELNFKFTTCKKILASVDTVNVQGKRNKVNHALALRAHFSS